MDVPKLKNRMWKVKISLIRLDSILATAEEKTDSLGHKGVGRRSAPK